MNSDLFYTTLHYALDNGYKDCVELLIEAGADPNHSTLFYGNFLLGLAINKGGADCLEDLLSGAKTNVNFLDVMGTPLHLAIKANRIDCIKRLLDYKANPNILDEKGNTPLHLAVSNKRIDCIKRLLDYKANPNSTNKEDETPMHFAVNTGPLGDAAICNGGSGAG